MSADRDGIRVLYVLKRFPQLSQTFVIREIAELERLGVHVGVDVLGRPAAGSQQSLSGALAADVRYLPRTPYLRDRTQLVIHLRLAVRRPVVWTRLARRARHGEWRRFVQAGLVADRMRRDHFVHIHAHFASAASEVARDAAALAGCTYSVTAHAKDIFHDRHVTHLSARLRSAATVVTVSDFNRRHLQAALPAIPIVHVPNGVPVAPSAPHKARGPVLCVARLVEKKGVDTLLRAVPQLRERCPGLTIEVIGTGDDEQALHDLSAALVVDDLVVFRGAQTFDAVDAAYVACSMVVLPCRIASDGDRDGLPTVIVEAMARSRPVISTRILGIPEVVRHEVTGLLVEPDDTAALVDAIARLWHDTDLCSSLGDNGRDEVARNFDPHRSAARLGRVFAEAGSR